MIKEKFKLGKRKIQLLGGSMFVNLPKSWIENIGLGKSDLVEVILVTDGSLKIRPSEKGEE